MSQLQCLAIHSAFDKLADMRTSSSIGQIVKVVKRWVHVLVERLGSSSCS
jgi:hypothetical protein